MLDERDWSDDTEPDDVRRVLFDCVKSIATVERPCEEEEDDEDDEDEDDEDDEEEDEDDDVP